MVGCGVKPDVGAASVHIRSQSIINGYEHRHDCYRPELTTVDMCAAAPQLLAARLGSLAQRGQNAKVVIMQGSR